jgi:hypothetical protein
MNRIGKIASKRCGHCCRWTQNRAIRKPRLILLTRFSESPVRYLTEKPTSTPARGQDEQLPVNGVSLPRGHRRANFRNRNRASLSLQLMERALGPGHLSPVCNVCIGLRSKDLNWHQNNTQKKKVGTSYFMRSHYVSAESKSKKPGLCTMHIRYRFLL